ncbi:MAG: hypothetical protein ABJH57_02110 [Cyclobacteriaceae bacterium]
METKKYTVDEPTNIGVVESILKYTTLTILTALLAYFVAFILPFTRRGSRNNDELKSEYYGLIFGNLEIFNVVIALIAVGVMAYYIYSKNRFGRIFEIQISPDFVELTIKNTFNNKIRNVQLPLNTLTIQREPKSNDLHGKFEIVTFYSTGEKINYFNTAVTQWGNEVESYNEMMNELERIK